VVLVFYFRRHLPAVCAAPIFIGMPLVILFLTERQVISLFRLSPLPAIKFLRSRCESSMWNCIESRLGDEKRRTRMIFRRMRGIWRSRKRSQTPPVVMFSVLQFIDRFFFHRLSRIFPDLEIFTENSYLTFLLGNVEKYHGLL